MSKILEEYAAKRIAEAFETSKLEGKLEGRFEANIDGIKALMQTLHFSATEAMDALRIDERDHPKYMESL